MRIEVKPYRNEAGTMLAWLILHLISGMVVHDAKLMVSSQGKRWVALPSVKQVNPDGSPRMVEGSRP
jgi:hypothetical protein